MSPMTEAWYEAIDPYVPGTCVSDVRLPYSCDRPIRWGCRTDRAALDEPARSGWLRFWTFRHPRCAGYGDVRCEDGGHRGSVVPEVLAYSREHWSVDRRDLEIINILWPGRLLLASLTGERPPVRMVGRHVLPGDEDGVMLHIHFSAAEVRYRRFCYWPREQALGQVCLSIGGQAQRLTRDQVEPAYDRCERDLERRQCGVCDSDLFDPEDAL